MLAILGITSFVVTLGAWPLELVSDIVLFPLLGARLVGYLARRSERRARE